MRREEHGLAERAERADHLPRRAPRLRVEAGRRLVEEDEVGIADERDAEVEPPLLAARERLDPRARLLLQPDERDHLVDVARRAVVAGEDRVRLADGEVRPQLGLLEDDADPLAEVRRRPLGIGAEHAHLAGVAVAVALEDLDGRRLAGAVRAEQPEDLAFLDREVDPAHRLEVPVGLAQAADLDRRHARDRVDAVR